jgi:hypothetical protein
MPGVKPDTLVTIWCPKELKTPVLGDTATQDCLTAETKGIQSPTFHVKRHNDEKKSDRIHSSPKL